MGNTSNYLSPNDVLQFQGTPIKRDLFTSEQIVHLATPRNGRPPTSIAASKALRRVGIYGQRITMGSDNVMLYALRNKDKWDRRSKAEWASHYKKMTRGVKFK